MPTEADGTHPSGSLTTCSASACTASVAPAATLAASSPTSKPAAALAYDERMGYLPISHCLCGQPLVEMRRPSWPTTTHHGTVRRVPAGHAICTCEAGHHLAMQYHPFLIRIATTDEVQAATEQGDGMVITSA